jgi:VCBS repeat-containing protein
VTVTDDFGGTTTQDVTITITGTNDAAAISGTASGSVIEAGGVANATPGTPTASGTLTDTDVDNAANTFTAIPAGHATTNGYGTFGMTTGGVWTYTLNNNNAAVQALNVNGTLTDTFSVTTIDGTAKTVTVTINGANDAAVISGTKTGTVIEAGASNGGGTPTATGTLTDTDVDNTPNTFAVASGSASHGIYSMTVGGVWTYTLNNADAAVNALNTGQTLADTFTVTTVDGTQQAINITIQGTTDAQLITSIVSSQQGNASTPTTITINFGVTGVINSFANAADPSSYVTLSNPSKGSLSLVANSGIFDAAHGTYSFQVNKSGGSNGSTFDVSISAGAFHDANGNTNSAASATGLHPAGISGEAINLGLAGHDSGDVLTISGAPSGWTLSEGTRNDDGTWTVVTNDASSLSVTSPDGYVGAMVLQIDQQFTAVDGSINHLFVADNVEAYAQGGPVFALSTEDHLTGSVGNDTFVFAGPIGADTIKSFDTAHDKIDLVHFTGFDTFADVQAHTTTDSAGNAVVSLGDGQSITLVGVNAGALSVDNFAFDQTPVTNNSGNMVISDGAIMPLGGEVDNTGVISLTAGNDLTSLQLIQHGLTLLGGGEVRLSDSSENVISGTGADVTLTNVDNTISGAGQLGDGLLTLINEGTIDATGTHALVIDTGANVVLNSGTLEASGSGGLVVDGDVFNSGFMWADGGNITIHGDVTGSGSALIDGSATLEFGGASAENTTFAEGSTGMLKLDHSLDFSGIVSGFGAGLQLDLADINFGSNATVGYSANQDGKGGILSVSDGGHTANINLTGQYAAEDFHILSDSGTGTLVTYVHTGLAPTDFHIV